MSSLLEERDCIKDAYAEFYKATCDSAIVKTCVS